MFFFFFFHITFLMFALQVELLHWICTKDLVGDGGVIKEIEQEGFALGSGYEHEHPKEKDEVLVKYTLYCGDEEVVSSSDEGVEFTVKSGHLIPAFGVAVPKMKKGEIAMLDIAPQYGFGEAGNQEKNIPANAKLRARIHLLDWKPVKVIEDSIVIKHLSLSDGYQKPNEGAKVKVTFNAKLEDGTVFEEKSNFEFVTDDGQVIPGLDRVVMELKKGEKVLATIPPEHAFGSEGGLEGKVPPNATVTYEIDLIEFENAKESYEMDAKEMMEAALTFKEKGNAYFKQGNYKVAMQKYGKAVKYLEFDQKYTEEEKRAAKKVKMACWNNEAQCGLKTKAYDGAKKSCNKVLAMDSQNIKALYRRAQSYIATKDYIEASTDLKNALLVDPNCKEAKVEMKRLLKLQAEYNNKQKKLYANMFGKMSKMDTKDKEENKEAPSA